MAHKPTGLFKVALKAPSQLYRVHLSFLFGTRFLMNEHRGRRSGSLYRTVVEIAGQLSGEWICTSGTGPGADWYRNLRAGGLEAIWIGAKRYHASVRFLDSAEAADVMLQYERAHPRAAPKLYDIMGVSYDGSAADLVRMMAGIPMVGFRVA